MVVLWNIQKLADGLKNDTVSGREKIDYVILSTVLFSLIFFLTNFDTSNPEPLTSTQITFKTISFLLEVVFAVVCYSKIAKLNEQGDDKNLVERVTCLGLPAAVRTTVLFYLPTAILSAAIFYKFNHLPIIDSAVELIIDIGFWYFFYSTLKQWVGYVSQQNSNEN